jgi:hypothetical protein
MPTPIFICGAECGLATQGAAQPVSTVGHWSAVTGTPSVVTSGPSPMRSERCFRFNPSAATWNLQHTFASPIASPATIVARFYVYFATLPSSPTQLWAPSPTGNGATFDSGSSTIGAGSSGAVVGNGVAVTTGQWYRIDVKCVRDATQTIDVQVNGVAADQWAFASVAGTLTGFVLGPLTTETGDWYIDDLIVSQTSGDYPIGAGTVAGLYPNGDRNSGVGAPQHTYSAVNDFTKAGNANTSLAAAASETTSWQSLTNPLSTTIDTTKYIVGVTGLQTEHLVWTMEDMPSDAGSVNGVASVSTHHSASATGNAQILVFIDTSANVKDLAPVGNWAPPSSAGIDMSETTIITNYRCFTTGTSSGAFTVANINDLSCLWTNTDVNPDTILDGVCLEVDYVPLPAGRAKLQVVRNRIARTKTRPISGQLR